ncbi:alpha/beta fold hydrolase [Streptomyces sp. PT12]|uniref:alpha/beta fold hydrolase n=1 Tax=Streptomyces sp. PT12 TaxID=1510197 RepID=UPI000DE4D6DA|nr:alpha/beta hydrolase [Streptomyces sp. PT12]RBM14409.1 alpha/beta hydrolase [Streptomyces sp. PT12]
MDIILIPGLWLDGSSWGEVAPVLQEAGHRTHALTLPGMESRDADRSGITLRDHIDAVVGVIDSLGPGGGGGGIALVGHSGGGAIAYGAADARPDRLARVVYVDCVPHGDGGVINDELPAVGGEVPLPDWSLFDPEDLVDLDGALRAAFRERAIPSPWQVAAGRQRLSDERRLDVPATVIACEFTGAALREWLAGGVPFARELARIRDVEIVDLPTGHWPQFTRPKDLAGAILAAVDRA